MPLLLHVPITAGDGRRSCSHRRVPMHVDMLHPIYLLKSYTDPRWHVEPAPVEDYEAFGFHPQGGQCWRYLWIPAPMARQYADLGLAPSEAIEWGVIPALVEAYRRAGIHQRTVRQWVAQGIMPDHARFLIRSGASPSGPDGHVPPNADRDAAESYEEDCTKWCDGFDLTWYDPDWPEPEEPGHPDERFGTNDLRHPYSPCDPFDPEDLIDPYAAGGLYADIDIDAPIGDDIPSKVRNSLPANPTRRATPRGTGANVIPLFGSRCGAPDWF